MNQRHNVVYAMEQRTAMASGNLDGVSHHCEKLYNPGNDMCFNLRCALSQEVGEDDQHAM